MRTEDSAQDATAVPGDAPDQRQAAPVRKGQVIAGRYRLTIPLGQGAFGEVWEATDHLGGATVAVKLLPLRDALALRAIRQEVTALRWLRLPGVVRLLDDGVEGGRYFLAMERVLGQPFPGVQGADLAALRPIVQAIAETLEQVHLAGVVHRDLKPGNLLVGADGRPTLLDFGLAVGEALAPGPGERRFAGTPRYAAPEQCRGELAGSAADLYALGVLVFEALTGTWPHAGVDLGGLLRRRAVEAAPPLRSLLPSVPSEIGALIDALLAVSPEDRPTAGEVAQALRGGRRSPLAVPLDAAGRARLFAGPDRFFRRDTDAARLLLWRAGPSPEALSAELDAWRRAGLARPEADGRLMVEPAALASLAAGLRLPAARDPREDALGAADRDLLAMVRLLWPDATPARLVRLLDRDAAEVGEGLARLSALGLTWPLAGRGVGAAASGDPAPGWTPRARREAHRRLAEILPRGWGSRVRHLAAAGAPPEIVLEQVRRALRGPGNLTDRLALEELGLQLARAEEDHAAEAELLLGVALGALEEEALPAIERALYALGRGLSDPDPTLDALLRAAGAGLRGEPERAILLLDALAPLDVEDLERWRVALRVRATALLGTPAEEALVDSLECWANAGSALRRAQWLGWRANLRYGQGRYAEAAALQATSVALRLPGLGRITARRSLAAALLEIPRLGDARAEAHRAAREARRMRHARFASLSLWLARNARFRAEDRLRPDWAPVLSAGPLGPHDQGLWAMTEAAIAWRTGRLVVAADLAQRATGCFERSRQPTLAVLTRALRAASMRDVPREALDALAEQAAALGGPDFAVQALGLIRRATSTPDPAWRALTLARAAARPESEWDQRLEVLSYREALA